MNNWTIGRGIAWLGVAISIAIIFGFTTSFIDNRLDCNRDNYYERIPIPPVCEVTDSCFTTDPTINSSQSVPSTAGEGK